MSPDCDGYLSTLQLILKDAKLTIKMRNFMQYSLLLLPVFHVISAGKDHCNKEGILGESFKPLAG